MRENVTSGEVIEMLVRQAGIRKKTATELLRAIPEIIEEGLKSDGEVRVKGLGTFRMKWTQPRVGRNPKTGERVDIPAHDRLVFLPEQSFKEFVNRDNRLLSYKVIPPAGILPPEEPDLPEPEIESQPVAGHVAPFQPGPETETETETSFQPELPIQPAEEINYDLPEESISPVRKRRIHWIVPTAIAVIIILSLVFYFRDFYQSGSQKTEDGRQKTEYRIQNTEESGQQAEVGGQQAVDTIVKPVNEQIPSTIDNRQSTIDNPNATILLSTEGKHLFRLAREVYGNPFLWVLIYRANLDKIPDPDMLISGKEIAIPVLEGKPDKLTRNDSAAVSDGYRLVYEYYQAKGDSRAEDFRQGVERYKP